MGLLTQASVATDGSKFNAVNKIASPGTDRSGFGIEVHPGQKRGRCEVIIVGAPAQILAFAQQKPNNDPQYWYAHMLVVVLVTQNSFGAFHHGQIDRTSGSTPDLR
jgi:hypothetical protein